ncbi:MAG: membrane protein insertase YidC [Acholeplasmataceae bacterium]|nr:membrane protein insertase YidC [Acholeplasmataceae bacterium]
MHKKIVVILATVMLLFVLAACGRGEDPIELIVVNNPVEKLVYEHDEGNSIIFTGDEGLSYWSISKSGAVASLDSYVGALPGYIEDEEHEGVRNYVFIVENENRLFQLYVKPETVDAEDTEIVMIALRFQQSNVLYPKGKIFDPTGMDIYVVRKNGDVETLKGEDVAEHFDDYGFDPMGEDGFKDQEKYTVTFTYEDYVKNFDVYVAGGEKPIHSGDATFFDWILVIPVAFIMQLFSGFFNHSFALGILFTTIVVRTLAWPIYAKSNDMSIKMNVAQPDMQRVQNKYATRKDPQSQQQMQMEMMQVYKKHGISVLGCLVPFMQMPIFIAMYGVVRRITLAGGMYAEQVSQTQFLGINLSRTNDGLIAMVLAGIVGVTMFILQYISMKKPSYVKNTQKHNPNPKAQQTEKTMKFVSYFMVIMMMFVSYQSNALALYWIFGNIYSLGQTIVNRRLNEKKHEKLQNKQLVG